MEGEPSIWFEILIILILVFANGVFAMTEIAIVSSRKARLEKYAADGSDGAKAALDLANDPTPLLSTVQVGITLIGIFTGAYGGATIAQALVVYLRPLPVVGPYRLCLIALRVQRPSPSAPCCCRRAQSPRLFRPRSGWQRLSMRFHRM